MLRTACETGTDGTYIIGSAKEALRYPCFVQASLRGEPPPICWLAAGDAIHFDCARRAFVADTTGKYFRMSIDKRIRSVINPLVAPTICKGRDFKQLIEPYIMACTYTTTTAILGVVCDALPITKIRLRTEKEPDMAYTRMIKTMDAKQAPLDWRGSSGYHVGVSRPILTVHITAFYVAHMPESPILAGCLCAPRNSRPKASIHNVVPTPARYSSPTHYSLYFHYYTNTSRHQDSD